MVTSQKFHPVIWNFCGDFLQRKLPHSKDKIRIKNRYWFECLLKEIDIDSAGASYDNGINDHNCYSTLQKMLKLQLLMVGLSATWSAVVWSLTMDYPDSNVELYWEWPFSNLHLQSSLNHFFRLVPAVECCWLRCKKLLALVLIHVSVRSYWIFDTRTMPYLKISIKIFF